MSDKLILIIEDDDAVREMLRFMLVQSDFRVDEAADVHQARQHLSERQPDMILLDWMLPGTSGIDYIHQLKRDPLTRYIPVIMTTAKSEEDDRVRGLDSGADDYITKPFLPRELVARIKAVWRRGAPEADDKAVETQGLCLDPASYRVTANGEDIELGLTEFRLLHFLMTHPERVYSRGQLLDRVWGDNTHVDDRTVDVYIRRLRKTLETRGHDRFLQTVRGAGYRFSVRI